MTYKKDTYYEGLGTYLGTRIIHDYTGTHHQEHLFKKGTYDVNGAAELTRIKIPPNE